MYKIIFIVFCAITVHADVSHIVNNHHYDHNHHDHDHDQNHDPDNVHHNHYNEHAVDKNYVTTPATIGPPNPYVFSYQAGRAPGHVDRQHTEVSDGTGIVRGAFSYVDPRNQVRTVQYVADDQGFHPQLSHEVKDSAAVAALKQKHYELYNRIAQEHATGVNPSESLPKQSEAVLRATQKHLNLYEQIAAQHAAIGAQHEAQRLAFEATSIHPLNDHNHNDDNNSDNDNGHNVAYQQHY